MNMTLDEDDINAYIGAIILINIIPVCHYVIIGLTMNGSITPTCRRAYRVGVSMRHRKYFTFRFPHRKFLMISFARYVIYITLIVYVI